MECCSAFHYIVSLYPPCFNDCFLYVVLPQGSGPKALKSQKQYIYNIYN